MAKYKHGLLRGDPGYVAHDHGYAVSVPVRGQNLVKLRALARQSGCTEEGMLAILIAEAEDPVTVPEFKP